MASRQKTGLALALLLVVAALGPVLPASAAPLIVDFEDLSFANTGRSFTSLSTHRGIAFPDGVTAIDYSRPGYSVSGFSTHSGTVGIEECFGSEFSCPDPIDMSFSSDQYRVKAWVGYTQQISRFGRVVVLEAFDASGRAVGRSQATLRSQKTEPIPVNTPLEVVAATNSIRSARIRFVDANGNTTDSSNLVADDIEIERGVPAFTIAPNPVDYGQVTVGQSSTGTAIITNSGQVNGAIKGARITGGNSADFSITSDGCSGRTIGAGATCSVGIQFSPKATGGRTSTLAVDHSAAGSPSTTRLVGGGTTQTTVATTPTTPTTPTTRPSGSAPVPPPTVTVPPPTAGATLVLDRTVGPPGSALVARGTGFQPGPVSLTWVPGIGAFETVAGADGTFETSVVVLMDARVRGPRSLVAVGPATSANAPFLVVPGSMHPGGRSADIVHRR